jgi:predicted NBD/HSP70 family sugar kinase
MGRAELARELGLSTQAVSNIIADLLTEDLLSEKGTRTAGRGLPTALYGLNANGAFALGVEIRPNAVFAALLNLKGEPVYEQRMQINCTDPEVVCGVIVGLREAALEAAQVPYERLVGIGIVMPGPFGQTGLSGKGTDLSGWENVDAQAMFQSVLGVPVEVSNDANAAAMAERITGAAKDLHSYAYLYFGTGLGLGLVSQGHLIPGAFGNAGEIGHIPVPHADRLVPLETVLSRASLTRCLQDGPADTLDFDKLDLLFATGDARLNNWVSSAAVALAHALQIVENLFDPQTVLLGGAMPSGILDRLVELTELPIVSVSRRSDTSLPRLQRGVSGRMTATRGAAALILNQMFTPQIAVAT